MKTFRYCFTLASILVVGTVYASIADAQTVINSVPYTITASGKYTLNANLSNSSTTTPAITINAPNVILDLNECFITGPSNTASQNSLIYVNDYPNITIKNGTLANEGRGINFVGTSNARNYVVASVTFTHCYFIGLYIESNAPGSVVSNCTFSDLGKSTAQANIDAYAIIASGGCRIENNTIATATPTGNSFSFGIFGQFSDFSIGNTISNCNYGIYGGKYLNNLTSGCNTPFSSGTNATGNN